MSAILVTGAEGFVGRHLCARLARQGLRVYGTRRPQRAAPAGDGVEWIAWDMAQDQPPPLPAGLSAIVNLAQSSRYREFPEQAADVFAVNVRATFALLDAARRQGVRTFIHASSGSVYGRSDAPATERTAVVTDASAGFYAASKLMGELLAQNFDKLLTVSILRLFFVYGPGQQADRFMPRLIDNVARGRPVTLEGADGISVNPVFASDAIEAIVNLLTTPAGGIFNIAGKETITLRRLAGLAGELLGRDPHFETRSGSAPVLVGDTRLAAERFGWLPAVTMREGLGQTVAAYAPRPQRA
jgi:nucleoside-diphosphate-sugar epimerase